MVSEAEVHEIFHQGEDEFGPVGYIQFGKEVFEMGSDRGEGDLQETRDFPVRKPLADQEGDVRFRGLNPCLVTSRSRSTAPGADRVAMTALWGRPLSGEAK